MTSVETVKLAIQKFSNLLSGKGVSVVFRGSECHTDGSTITLPALELLESKGVNTDESRRYLSAIVGFVVHEVGHVLHSDFKAWRKASPSMPGLQRNLTNAIEDAYVERETCAVWEGAIDSLTDCYTWVLERDSASYKALPVASQLVAYLCYALGGGPRDQYVPHFNPAFVRWVDTELADEIKDAAKVKSTRDSIALAQRIYDKIKASEDKAREEEQEAKESDGVDPCDSESGGSDEKASPSDDTEDNGAESTASDRGDDSSESDASDPDTSAESGDPSEGASEANPFEGAHKDEVEADDQEALKERNETLKTGFEDLADSARGSCLSDGVPYVPYDTSDDYIGPVDSTCNRSGHLSFLSRVAAQCTGALKAALGRTLIARGTAYDVRALERGRLDKRRLWNVPVARASDVAPRIFSDSVVSDTYNVAVLIVIDQSGSMSARACNVFGQRLSRADMAIAATLALGDALRMLRIPFGVFGHATGDYHEAEDQEERAGRDAGRYSRFGSTHFNWSKGFHQDWQRQRKETVHLVPEHANHDAEAVYYGVRQLRAFQGVDRRILLVLSDGAPAGTGGGHSDKRQTMELHTAVESAKDVEIIGIGMATASVKEYYPDHIVIDDMSELPKQLLTKLGDLLGLNRKRRRSGS